VPTLAIAAFQSFQTLWKQPWNRAICLPQRQQEAVRCLPLAEDFRVPRRLGLHEFSWKALASTEHPVVKPREKTVLRLDRLQPAFVNRPR